MFARVRILDPHGADGDTLAPEVLAVPEGAIQRAGSETVVYVALDEGRFSRRPVTLGRRGEGYVEILSGLAAGEEVVIEGAFFVKSELAREELGGGHSH
jgi:cobalt-zinc-cadmium efflux system membrane fusion protein